MLCFTPLVNGFVANSTTYTLGGMIQSTTGGIANSTTYEVRSTQHYQQPIGNFESTTYRGALRWLQSTIYAEFLIHFIIQEQTCFDNNTLQIDTFFRYNNIDTLLSSEYVPCALGCGENEVDVCINLDQEINYSYLGLISILLSILFFLFIYARSKTEILKTFSITLSIFLSLIAVFLATIPGGLSNNFLIDMIEGASSSIYFSFAMIILALVLFTFILFITSFVRKKNLFQYGLEEEEFDE